MSKTIILASSSPRRIELMKKGGFEPIVISPDVNEDLPEGIAPRDAVMLLSLRKALAVKEKLTNAISLTGEQSTDRPDPDPHDLRKPDIPLIVAADTVVYKDSILGKPTDKQDALKMLLSLSGTSHLVMTGVTVTSLIQMRTETFCDITEVFFKQYGADDLAEYLETPEAYDKAGAYAIQGWFSRYTDHIDGDRDTVIGLPVARVKAVIDSFTESR